MREYVYKTRISNVRTEAILLDEGFAMKRAIGVGDIMSHIKYVHQHSTYEIFFVLDGELTVSSEQGSKVYQNCIVIIPPAYNHYTVSNVQNGYCFYFTMEPTADGNDDLFSRIASVLRRSITSFELNDTCKFYTTQLAISLEEKHTSEKTPHLLYLILSDLFEKIDPQKDVSESAKIPHNKYIHIIDAHITQKDGNVTLTELANALYLSPKQVARIIKKEYGCFLSELIHLRKLTAACMLLKHTDLPVAQIARTVGYEHENRFFALFKKMHGITPLQYRKQRKNA